MAEPTTASLRTVRATRYVTPLREGGSMPGLVEADDDGLYVVKFRGAGQGPGALVAEVVAGELARALGLPVPELVLAEVDLRLARAEPDPEIQELIEASAGINLGVDFLPGSLSFTTAAAPPPDEDLAAETVWLDALVTNVDRTPRNPNLLLWHERLWLIDHGAALYRMHGGEPLAATARRPFPQIADHVLLGLAGSIAEADERLAERATAVAPAAVAAVPDEWLGEDPAGRRADLAAFLAARLEGPRAFAAEAEEARRGR
jgi:HipA-like protein